MDLVEVGVGSVPEVALFLAPHVEVLATDKEAQIFGGLTVVEDDIFSPNMELYRGASLLYSLRPPQEMQLAMGELAQKIGADVIVRPLAEEVAQIPGFSRTIINEGERARLGSTFLRPPLGKLPPLEDLRHHHHRRCRNQDRDPAPAVEG